MRLVAIDDPVACVSVSQSGCLSRACALQKRIAVLFEVEPKEYCIRWGHDSILGGGREVEEMLPIVLCINTPVLTHSPDGATIDATVAEFL